METPPIRLKNTATKKVEEFMPLKGGHVSMYHCGPTVYQRATIGNLRPYVMADTLRRTFEQAGYKVAQVINITDAGHLTDDASDGEDKVEREAAKTGMSTHEITTLYTKLYMEDIGVMNLNTSGTRFPKATEHITEQIELIKKLEKDGYTYVTKDAVYFDTSKFDGYGKLGGIDIEGQKAGARIGENPEKKNSPDFALWKFSPKSLDASAAARQQEWESPWGVGFPGWHIECSAMSMKYLGETFDIHTGGIDHIPVHHNNEIAQSEAITHQPLARYWLHNNFITIDGQRVGKSMGNALSLDDLNEKWQISPLAYRYWLLTAHYSSQTNVTQDALKGAASAYERLCAITSIWIAKTAWYKRVGWKKVAARSAYGARIIAALRNDLDTPKAIATLWDATKDVTITDKERYAIVRLAEQLLGLPLEKRVTSSASSPATNADVPVDIADLADQRDAARMRKDWVEADRLRKLIEERGFGIADSSAGTKILKK
jgi:cysteinyl-tRNA synthetase